jgi:tellurite methyltransferase
MAPPPEKETTACDWLTGELFTYYNDWKIENLMK